jgi:hypothetical protein
MPLAAFAAELRTLATPHALVRRADVRRDALLDLARRLDKVQLPAPVERRQRRPERSDPWAEIRRALNETEI